MLETLLEHPFFLNRHREAPLLKERETFLTHLQQQGTSRKALRNLSGELLQVVRLLKLDEMRDVALEEIQRAARRWARQQRSNPKAHSYGNSASSFIYAAKKWLRFHGRLKTAQCAAHAVCRSTPRLRPLHDRGTRSLSAFRPIPLLEDIEVPGLVWRAASIVGAGERRRRGRVPCDERRGRMESQICFGGCAGAAGFLPVRRNTRLVFGRFRQRHSSTKNLPIRGPARRPDRERGAAAPADR